MAGNGLSFIVRIHNEEATLERSIRSLAGVTVPHEIVLILHRCTDRSPEIAASLAVENPHVHIVMYDHAVSRAGYETLATDTDSLHSFIRYSNWSVRQAKYAWVFKWDADFVASGPLIQFINRLLWEEKNMHISVVAKNSTTKNRENYLCGGPRIFTKHVFWENNNYSPGAEFWHFEDVMYIEHASELSDLKSYWNESPWYASEDSEEARLVKSRIDRLVSDFGAEPRGMARASNPECDAIFSAITTSRNGMGPEYVNLFS